MTHLPAGTYDEYLIPKKKGKFRKIVAPSASLLTHQRQVLNQLNTDYAEAVRRLPIKNTAHGFVKNKNCITAAEQHIGFETTIMMDISTFFDDVKFTMLPQYADPSIWHAEQYAAQGFATSPMLANIAFIPALSQIHEYLDDYFIDFAFTIYADDIQISVNTEDLEELNDIISAVTAIIETQGFRINQRKTRIRYAKFGFRRILGVNVGPTEVRATRKVMRKIRAARHQKQGPSLGGLTTWSQCHKPKHYKE